MTRNLKALGLALVAALALSAVAASAASAEPAKFTAAVGAGVLSQIHGEQSGGGAGVDTFKIGTLPPLTCVTAKETGFGEETVNKEHVHKKGPEAASATFTPEYVTCHVVLLGITKPVTVTLNGCTYTFTATKDKAAGTFSADLTICNTGGPIEIHVYNDAAHNEVLCTYDVTEQTINDQITLTNIAGSPSDVLAHINATVAVDNTIPGGICSSSTSAVYTGTHTLRATDAEGKFVNTSVS